MPEGSPRPRGRFAGPLRALPGIITLCCACTLPAAASAAPGAAAAKPEPRTARSAARTLSAPRNLTVRRRTASSISLRWMRARGSGRPHTFLVFVNGRRRVATRRKGATVRGLRCGTRYRIDVATRDRRGRTSERKTRFVRTSRCKAARRGAGQPSPATPGTGAAPGATGSSQGGGSGAAIPGSGTRPGSGIPPGGGTAPGVGPSLPARLPQSTGTTFHVTTTGSDSAAGSESAPWRTIQKALNTLQPGQTALVHGGTYAQGLNLSRAGTPSAPITVRNAPGEQAIVQPGASGNGIPLSLGRGAAYARFYGLIFEGARGSSTTNVYAFQDAHDIEVSGCENRGSARQGFYVEPTASKIHIIGCYIHDNGGSGPTQQDHNIYLQGTDNAVLGNLITGAVNGYGVQVYPSSERALVAGNTITGSFRDGVIIGSDGGGSASNTLVVNNILSGNRAPISSFWGGGQGAGNVVRNNLSWGNNANDFNAGGVSISANLVANPLFVNAAAGDFHLSPGSPALGIADLAYVLPADIDGDARPLGGGPDLGAFES